MDSETLYEKLMNASLNYVSYRPRSRKEVDAFILKTLARWKTEGAFIVEKVIARLVELGYVDDMKFAMWWITQRSSHRPKGLRALQFELQSKGIAASVTAAAFAEVQSQEGAESEFDLAKKAIQKKIDQLGRLPIIEQKKKIYSYLATRGFGGNIIAKIIDELTKKEYN
jgi:regulatory protein